MRFSIGLTVILAGYVASACASDTTNPGDGGNGLAANEVAVRDNLFLPASLTVTEGTTVAWVWQGDNLHTVTLDAPNLPDSDPQSAGRHEVTFTEPGRFSYYCTIHGRAMMSGEIVVERTGGPTD